MNARLFAALVIMVLAAIPAPGQTPFGTAFTYQGRLENGPNLASGLHDLRFGLYDASAGGAQVGAALCINNVNVAAGLFTVALDFGAQFTGEQRFLEIDVRADAGWDCANASGFIALTPRQALTAAPNALNADRLDGLDSTVFLQSIPIPLTLTGTSNNWMIKAENATTAAGAAAINGTATGLTGNTYGVFAVANSSSGIGVFGRAASGSGTTSGVYGQTFSTTGHGVFGKATAATGATYGGRFESDSESGYGVRGNGATGGYFESIAVNGYGVYGIGGGGDGGGGWFESDDLGVFARATATTGGSKAGHFESHSQTGIGVYAVSYGTYGVFSLSVAESGVTSGVYGSSESSSGRGVMGESNDNIGVYGLGSAASGTNYGVYGESASTTGRGVTGSAQATSGVNYGVHGSTGSGSGYGVYSTGDFGATGTKAFRIDHPSDPENKYLLHYATESPFPQNSYSGNVVTDAQGSAWVELPDYFAEINANFKYQLTVVEDGASANFVQVKIGRKISGNRFLIMSSGPNVEVSWRVDADRNDLYVRQKQPRDVVEKQEPERGTYQHPELYGQPPEKGMNFDVKRERHSPPRTAAQQRVGVREREME